MNSSKEILIIAGEASGDLYGSSLVAELKKLNSEIDFFGMGGNQMKEQGVRLSFHIDQLGFMGIAEVLKNLRFIRQVGKKMVSLLDQRKPDLVILIDYPGFNLRFAKQIKKRRITLVYYISPQIWAWGGKRINKIKKYVDKMIVILPFEKEIYQKAKVDVEFVGHPLLDIVKPTLSQEDFKRKFDIRKNQLLVGLLPGSRWQEVEKILPPMLRAVEISKRKLKNITCAIGLAPTIPSQGLEDLIGPFESKPKIVENLTYDLMKYSDLLLVTSGTATLESAILETPLIILYKTHFLTWLIGKNLVKLPNIGLVNILAGKRIVPEYLQKDVQPEKIASQMEEILENREKHKKIKEDLKMVKQKLGEVGASKKTAQIINQMLS
ncbi:MAG TPA: lipid-A-disaccharide synthase [candidate division Zixibacteria bacterium]